MRFLFNPRGDFQKHGIFEILIEHERSGTSAALYAKILINKRFCRLMQ